MPIAAEFASLFDHDVIIAHALSQKKEPPKLAAPWLSSPASSTPLRSLSLSAVARSLPLRLLRRRVVGLVADLATWIPSFPPSLATLSNIEGLSFGPPGPKGERTVMLVSDDNFRPTQTTAFIWFALP